jgi:tripartite-type tricarboxylate transporter receptor subunit TctC
MTALLGGEVGMVMIGVPSSLPHIKSGKVRPLAVSSPERLPALPDVPTSREAGVDNFEVSQWYGVLAPAGTPRDVITHLNAEWVKIASMPDTMEKMRKVEFEPMSSTPEQFAEFVKTEIVRWGKVIRDANLSID